MYKIDFMKLAILEGKKALSEDEVPIGAVIVKNGKVIATAYNCKNRENMVTRHAEIIAIEKASKLLENWRLNDCEMYVTLEPCPMCMSAIQQSRISNVYYGIKNSDPTNQQIIKAISKKSKINPGVNLSGGYMQGEISLLLTSFFKKKRKNENE